MCGQFCWESSTFIRTCDPIDPTSEVDVFRVINFDLGLVVVSQ